MIFGMDWKNWSRAWRRITVFSGVVVALALVSAPAAIGTEMADLSARDWLVAGDGKLTYDRSTGLEWLDLTETLNHSIVATEALPFFDASGANGKFRWATGSEIANLLAAPGVPFSDYETYYSINVAAAATLIDLLGGVPYGGGIKAAGVSRANEPAPGVYAVSHVFVIGAQAQIVHPTPPLACCIRDFVHYQDVGAWLVRSTTIVPSNNPPVCDTAQASPSQLWPPNHQLAPVRIVGVTDPDGDTTTVTVTAVSQDEPVNGLGDGDTCPDASIQGSRVLLRAERAGPLNGRVYHIAFTANDGRGGQCSGAVTVCVPHDKSGRPCIDDVPLVDSTSCP